MDIDDQTLKGIVISSGVSLFTLEPFCKIEAASSSGQILSGQLTPDEVRAMAMAWLTAAAGAELESEIFRAAGEDNREGAAALVAQLRQLREQRE